MRKFIFKTTVLLLIIIAMVGCKTIEPQMPTENYTYVTVKPQTSAVSLFADLEITRLEALINSNTDSVLYDDNSLTDNGGDNLMLKAWKNGQIKISLQDNLLSWEIPLRLSIKKAVFMVAFNHPIGDIVEANGEINLKFKTNLSVNSDWSIKTITNSDDYEWTKKPTLKVGGITIPVTPIASLLLKVNLDGYSKKIDETIAGSFNFRHYAEKGWQMMFEPMKIPGNYNAWLSMTPTSVSLMPIKGSNGHIRFGTKVTADIECLLDKQPTAAKVTPLPNLLSFENASDTFRINLMTDIPYPTIERLTFEELRDSSYSFGDKRLKFESLRVYGSSGLLTVETKVKGSIKGTIYLTGTPYFHPTDTTLRIKNLKFDLKTRNLWMKSAKWLFNGKMERTLTEAIAIPFKSNVRDIESNIQGYLNHRKLGYGFELNSNLTKISVSELILTPESVKANLLFSGKLSLGMDEGGLKIPADHPIP
ncbi:MAG: DUF4403 family protein [Prolixibacteraceae bacterium]|nr:DUF4403 family protein [Prolixibacteraceae bacterium]